MTIEERLRAAAEEIKAKNIVVLLGGGSFVDVLLIEAADEIRRIHETFGRTLLEEEDRKLMTFFGAQMVEAACSGALKYAQAATGPLAKEAVETKGVGLPPAPALVTMGPIEAGFYARHLRHIDIAGDTVCQGGTVRCDDCRCGIPDDWRAQDAEALAKEGRG